MVLADFGTGQVFWSILWFTMFFIWIWLLIVVFSDIFRSPDLGGGAKAIWTIFVILVPYLGVFVYLIARGHKMGEHAVAEAQASTRRSGPTSSPWPARQPGRRDGQGWPTCKDKGLSSTSEFAGHEGQDPRLTRHLASTPERPALRRRSRRPYRSCCRGSWLVAIRRWPRRVAG